MIAFIFVAVIVGFIFISAYRDKKEDVERQRQQAIDSEISKHKMEYEIKKEELEKEYSIRYAELQIRKEELEKEYSEKTANCDSKIKYQEKIIKDFDKIIIEKCNYYPQLAAIMADLLTVYYERSAKFLEEKSHPALSEALRIRELKAETKKILTEKKNLEYQLTYIKTLFPNIIDVLDPGFEEDNFVLETEETTDRVRNYLSDEEFKSLSENERNQLALDRYLNNRTKSKWQIGRDYEMYIGYLCESVGYHVTYTGIIKKLEDMGRDLIVIKDCKTYIIQCKYWSQQKEIHEKHIFQLFGTVTLYKIQHPFEEVFGVFVSPNNLSKTAIKVAKELNIQIVKKELGTFPRIKCNINRTTKEKIYHLPFDQQYDSVIIEKNKGEFLAYSVQEAYDKGFRRAHRHIIK